MRGTANTTYTSSFPKRPNITGMLDPPNEVPLLAGSNCQSSNPHQKYKPLSLLVTAVTR